VSILDKNHDLTVDIAESALSFAEDSGTQLITLSSTPRECSANLTRNKGRERVGKLVYRISRISIFADGASEKNFTKKKIPERDELNVLCNLPDFQFSRLVKPIHWERLKGLNLDRWVPIFFLLPFLPLPPFISYFFLLDITISISTLISIYIYIYVYVFLSISIVNSIFIFIATPISISILFLCCTSISGFDFLISFAFLSLIRHLCILCDFKFKLYPITCDDNQ
jgi:hypothetical protein